MLVFAFDIPYEAICNTALHGVYSPLITIVIESNLFVTASTFIDVGAYIIYAFNKATLNADAISRIRGTKFQRRNVIEFWAYASPTFREIVRRYPVDFQNYNFVIRKGVLVVCVRADADGSSELGSNAFLLQSTFLSPKCQEVPLCVFVPDRLYNFTLGYQFRSLSYKLIFTIIE